MKPIKFIYLLILTATMLNSCSKDNNSPADNTPPIPPTPPVTPPFFPAEAVKAIYLTITKKDVNGYGVSHLTVLEPNGALRWEKAGRGANTYENNITYSNGIIFSIDSYYDGTDHIGRFYAYDINSGVDLWSKIGNDENYYFPVVRNDTLFCSTSRKNYINGNIAAFNARTGELYWRQSLGYPYYPVYLLLDGDTLFFIVTTSSITSKVISFNIKSKKTNWESASLGVNFASTFSKLVVSPTRVIVKTGTKTLMAFDRSNGSTIWTRNDILLNQPVLNNNIVFAASSPDAFYDVPDSLYGLYAFDAASGNKLWHWQRNIIFSNANPFISGDVIFYSGLMKKDSLHAKDTGFINAIDARTGNELWRKYTGINYEQIPTHPVAVGSKVYFYNYSSGLAGSQVKLTRYDGYTGEAEQVFQFGEYAGKVSIIGSSDKVYTPN